MIYQRYRTLTQTTTTCQTREEVSHWVMDDWVIDD